MHFYELHEGDGDVFADLLLVREDEMEPEEFFDVVQSIRRRIQDSHEHQTLIEAIARGAGARLRLHLRSPTTG